MNLDPASASQLEEKIGYVFSDKSLLQTALTHSSFSQHHNYERLEFLGDRVLGLTVSDILYREFPDDAEGDLAKRLSALVQGTMLAQVAHEIDLGSYISFSDAERASGGGANDNILADVLEALIGALYIDGRLAACQAMIHSLWGERLYTLHKPPQHPKTHIQEWAQGLGLPLPVYEITGQSGPDHAPIFEITLKVQGYKPIVAQGASRQESERMAARLFLEKLDIT